METLRRQRGSLKAKITNFNKFTTDLQEWIAQNTNNDEERLAKVTELQLRLERFTPVIDEFEEIQVRIEQDAEDMDAEITERDTFTNEYYAKLAAGTALLQKFSDDRVDSSSNNDALSEISVGGTTNIKLPQIHLPSFNGSSEEWLEFRDTFESLIHVNNHIGNVEKFHYLRSTVKGSAAQLINSINFSAANYIVAWEMLCDRYNNTNLLIKSHLRSLFDLQSVKENANEFRRLIDNIAKNIRALQLLKEPVESWGTIIIYMVCTKLDKQTVKEWEESKSSEHRPTLDDFATFLRQKASLLETLESSKSDYSKAKPIQTAYKPKTFLTNNFNCKLCNQPHKLFACEVFLKMTPKERHDAARKFNLCLSCLKSGHFTRDCKASKCKRCNRGHNTLLHDEQEVQKVTATKSSGVVLTSIVDNGPVLLATVMVNVVDDAGKVFACRALLDCGAQSNFVTKQFVEKLNIQRDHTNMDIVGINQQQLTIQESCILNVHSQQNAFKIGMQCLVIPNISDDMPNCQLTDNKLTIPSNLNLADPQFTESRAIDMLIGAGVFWKVLCIGQHKLGKGLPVLQKTMFGWIVTGGVKALTGSLKLSCNFARVNDIQRQLERFWQIEEWEKSTQSKDDIECENIFTTTTTRNDGRFVVTIPLCKSADELGESESQALERLHSLEKKLAKNPEFKNQYYNFMSEYEDLGHMTKIQNTNTKMNYLPHHGVVNTNSETTRLRVVFDGSARTSTGVSFNDLQYVGPSIQDELIDILLRFRKHSFVINADIHKMYRQILVQPTQKHLQAVLWRTDMNKNPETYVLNTVTYGTRSAPFLAIRCLKQLAMENNKLFPKAAKTIESDFYVIDLLSGAESIEEAVELANQIRTILQTAKF